MKKVAVLFCALVIVLCGCNAVIDNSSSFNNSEKIYDGAKKDISKPNSSLNSSADGNAKKAKNNTVSTSSQPKINSERTEAQQINPVIEEHNSYNVPMVKVPNVVGKTIQEAENILSDLYFSIEKLEVFSDTYAKGIVVHQSLWDGENVVEGEKITISVSKGAGVKVTVPDVTAHTLEDATQILSQSGLRIKTTIKCSDEVAEGYIISQNQAAGTQLGQDSYVDVLVSAGVANKVGNSISNSQQFGLVASQGDWIYYSNMNYDYYLYKMRKDGSQKQIVTKGCVVAINVVGEWIYYTDENQSNRGIYKIKLDGTEKTKLISGRHYWVYVAGDKIYYSPSNYSGKIYCMNTDGSSNRVVCSENCAYANVVGEWIYYINADTYDVYKIRTDGSERTRVHNSFKAHGLIYENGQLFADYNNDFQCINVDGTGLWHNYDGDRQRSFLNINNGWIYMLEHDFTSGRPKSAFYRVSADYEVKQKIADINFKNTANYYINVVDEWLFFKNEDDNGYMYRIKADGTGLQKVYM